MNKKTKKIINRISIISIILGIVIVLSIILLFVAQKNNRINDIAYTVKKEIIIKDRKINSNREEYMTNDSKAISDEIIKGLKYIVNEISNKIEIKEYLGDEEILIIPSVINGLKIQNIDENAFKNCENLEKIKIPKELQELDIKLKYFEINESADNEEYIEYITTKEYNESYLKYLELPEEEKNKVEEIPSKFYVPAEEINTEEFKELYAGTTTIPQKYDMRNYIKIGVEDQRQYGICYAYATLTAVETNVALRNKNLEEIDLSEIQCSIITEQYSGGNFYYTLYKYGENSPVSETDWDMNNIYMPKSQVSTTPTTNNRQIINRLIYEIDGVTETEINKIESAMKKSDMIVDITSIKRIPTITQEMKKNNDSSIKDIRNAIKQHIMKYGSLYASIEGGSAVNGLNGYKKVMNYNGSKGTNHAISIIGWDDNFSKYNFPESNRPKNNGAYLALNSWGDRWGNNGCFWISYEDKYVESNLWGVISAKSRIDSISIKNMPQKQKYYINEKVDTKGLVLTVTYDDGTKKDITSGFECAPTILSREGIQKIMVTYGGRKATFNVEVQKKTIDMSGIEFNNKVVEYNGKAQSIKIIGELPKGIKGVTYEGNEKINAGKYEVVAKFAVDTNIYNSVPDKKAKLTIKKANPIVNPLYDKEKIIYEGDPLPEIKLSSGDTEGRIEWEEYKTLSENKEYSWLYTPKDSTNYNIKKGKENIEVIKIEIVGISIKAKPEKLNYYVGDELDTTGLILTVKYNNGKIEDITSGFEYTPKILEKAGTQAIMVTYGGEETTFNVEVKKKTIDTSEIQFNNKTVEYNGKPQSIEIEGKLPEGIENVIYEGNKQVNAGEYEVIAKFMVDIEVYNQVEDKKAILKIEKASPIVNPMYDKEKIIYLGGSLPKIELSSGDTEGIITWDEYELQVGTKEYTWIYIPQDTANYKSKTGKISFTVKEFKNEDILVDNSEYKVKEEGEIYITNIMPKTSIEEYKKQIVKQFEIEMYNKTNNKVTDEKENVKTGMKMKVYISEKETKEYKTVVTGDLNGDGQMNDIDVLMMVRYKAKLYEGLKGEYLRASDIVKNGKYAEDIDLLKMARILVGLDEL